MLQILKLIAVFPVLYSIASIFLSISIIDFSENKKEDILDVSRLSITVLSVLFVLFIIEGSREAYFYAFLNVLPAILVLYGVIFRVGLAIESSRYHDYYSNNRDVLSGDFLNKVEYIKNITEIREYLEDDKKNIIDGVKNIDVSDSINFKSQHKYIKDLIDNSLSVAEEALEGYEE